MKIMTEYGTVTLDADVIASIAGAAATNCFGVKGMTHTSVKDGIVYLLKREAMTKGVKVTEKEDKIDLELHIAVDHGINIGAVQQIHHQRSALQRGAAGWRSGGEHRRVRRFHAEIDEEA